MLNLLKSLIYKKEKPIAKNINHTLGFMEIQEELVDFFVKPIFSNIETALSIHKSFVNGSKDEYYQQYVKTLEYEYLSTHILNPNTLKASQVESDLRKKYKI